MKIPIDRIYEGMRLRSASAVQVTALVASIKDVGLLNPITVVEQQRYEGGNRVPGYALVAGLHRLRAMQEIGSTEIEATVVELSDLERQIAECDENLAGPKLSASERARFTRRRKDAYEALHPEAKRGGDRRSDQTAKLAVWSFAEDQAAATGSSERTVHRDAERAEKVLDEVLDLIRGTVLDTGAYLDRIKPLPPNDQVRAAKRDLALVRSKEPAEVAKAKARKVKATERQLSEKRRIALILAWGKADDRARAAFKEEVGLVAIMKPAKPLVPGAHSQGQSH